RCATLACASSTSEPMSRLRTSAVTATSRLPFSPADLVRSFGKIEAGDVAQRDRRGWSARGCLRQRNGKIFQRLDVAAQRVWEPHDNLEAAIALQHQAGRARADGYADR